VRVVNGGGRAGEGGCLTVGTAGLGDHRYTVSRTLFINHKSRIALAVRVGWVLLLARIFVIELRFKSSSAKPSASDWLSSLDLSLEERLFELPERLTGGS